MDAEVRKHVVNFKRARSNLLIMSVCTAANLLLAVLNTSLTMLFSATTPQFLFELGRVFAETMELDVPFIIGLVLALITIGFFLGCWLLAKRHRVFLLVALILFLLDSFLMAYLIVSSGFDPSFLPEIIFHVWVLYYLVTGSLAWAGLLGVPEEEFEHALASVK